MSPEPKLSDADKRELLQIARQTLEAYLSRHEMTPVTPSSPLLTEKRGAFVTLEKKGQLRGCIGRMAADKPLGLVIQEMAIQAATGDPRFPAVSLAELSEIEIEISVLSPLRALTDLSQISEIRIGQDGLVVSQGGKRGVLLPQVATRENWDREQFLGYTCLKAGLPFESWRGGEVKIEIFSAEVFDDKGPQT